MSFNNLPSQPTSFIGREKELVDLAALLDDAACRLITLVGAGGIGKTRLAIQAAANQEARFEDGVWFVALAPVGSTDLLPAAMAAAFEISFFGSENPHNQMMHYLREKHMFLVMDDFEHLLEATDFLVDLLQAAPRLKIVVTSRERLNLQEEWVYVLDGLDYPTQANSDLLANYSAVELFVQRARQVQVSFSLDENAQAVAAICRQVEGMPLGIELAASWLRVMSCQQIAAQMTSNLDFLTTPLRNVPERHRSLRVVFEQSWRMLSPDEQLILMKLSVFRGGFDLEAAEQVAGAALPVLAGLADKSLIRFNGKARYDLHELLRQYAADQLSDAGLTSTCVQQHIDYFLKLAERAESYLFGREQITWFDRLEVEMDNLRAAFSRSVESETGLRLAASLGWFFSERAYWNEGLNWLEQALAANTDAPPSLRAKALCRASNMADAAKVRIYCEQAIALAKSINDYENIAWSLSHMGLLGGYNADQSTDMLEESISLFRQIGDQMGLSHTLNRLAMSALKRGNSPYVQTLLNESAILAAQAGDTIMMGWVSEVNGRVARTVGDFQQAKRCFEKAISLFREAQFHLGLNMSLVSLAQLEMMMGDLDNSQRSHEEALISHQYGSTNHPRGLFILERLARISKMRGHLERAATLLAAADTDGEVEWAQIESEVDFSKIDRAEIRSKMDKAAFDRAWAAGKAMTRGQAIAYALESEASPTKKPVPSHPDNHTLTERERQILTLLSEGLNSREIAERLVLSVETIRWYLKVIYSKLDAHSRSEAIARAKELNLLA